MTDFGRKDFGAALKQLFEADAPLGAKDFAPVKKFRATGDAAAVDKMGRDALDKVKDDAGNALAEFYKLWGPFTSTLREETSNAVKQLELFAAANKSIMDEVPTTDDAAATAVLGGTRKDLAARTAASDAAPAARKMRGDKIQDLATGDFGSGQEVAPEDMYGKDRPEQQRAAQLASIKGAGDKRLQTRQARRARQAPPATTGEHSLSDFSNLLMEVVENMVTLSEAKPGTAGTSFLHMSPEERAAAGVKKPRGKAQSLREMIKTLRNFALKMDKQVEVMDGKLKEAMNTVRKTGADLGKTFSGLANLTQEQRQHIEEITTDANARLTKLKKEMEPLMKLKDKGSVAELVQKVQGLEKDLKAKQLEMDTQAQEYEDLLDYYEDIMIDMKKAEMEAKRELRNLEAEMAGGMTGADFAHTETKGKPLTESVKPKKKKKRPAEYQHYGTFNLNEHLQKAREANPKASHDW